MNDLRVELGDLWQQHQRDRTEVLVELATLKAKSGIFGMLGGLLPALALLLLEYHGAN